MMKSSSTSSRAYFIIGSSSPLSRALFAACSNEGDEIVVFGRTNPYKFENWFLTRDFRRAEAVDDLLKILTQKINLLTESGIKTINVVVIAGISSDEWHDSFMINQYLPGMLCETISNIATQHKRNPAIEISVTLIGSASAYLGGKLPYSATKASLTGIMHSTNRRSPANLRCNIILPGVFEGGMIRDWDVEKRTKVADNTIVKRIAGADEVADAIVFVTRNKYVADTLLNMTAGQVTIE